MSIAIVGAGGVGGYFGGRLAASGSQVLFVARGAHLAALLDEGLRITSDLGDVTVAPVSATDDPSGIGPVDLVVITSKLYETGDALARCAPLVGRRTTLLSVQNGVYAIRELVSAFGAHRVLAGVARIAAVIANPGMIRHTGTMAELTFGELDGRRTERVARIRRELAAAGIKHAVAGNIQRALWKKMVFLSVFSGLTTLYGKPVGRWRADPKRRASATASFAEAYAVARAHGAELPDDTPEQMTKRLDELPSTMVSSMLQDRKRGRRLELPWLSGAIVRLGAEKGIATPNHAAICHALAKFVNGTARGRA